MKLSHEQVERAIVPLLETDALLTVIPWRQITERLNEALATAPPEQARCSVVLTKEGDRCAAEAGHEGAHELDLLDLQSRCLLPANPPPQAVSDGALELSEDEVITCILDSLFPSSKVQILAADTTAAIKLASGPDGLTVQINRRLQQRLAAHDQKVREPLAAWMIENSFATGHGDTVEDLLKELKWQVEELRSSPAPAASKPEAGHE